MSTPARPTVQHQGPACHCVINGKCLGWLSCTSYATAMAVDKATLGAKRPTGCDIRARTNDTTGGLTLAQCAAAATAGWGVKIEVHTGSGVATPAYLAEQLRAGRGAVVQGSTRPLIGTAFRATAGSINHAVYANEVRGGTLTVPEEVLVYDPAADGRTAGWGTADVSPSWWPWSLLVKFAGSLQPWGEQDPRVLGSGRVYCALFADTEPHVHLKFGGIRTAPFPDRATAWNAKPTRKINVRRRPDRINTADIVDTLTVGEVFVAYQTTRGVLVGGSRMWYGNHDGNGWVHASGLKNIGGAS